jgi:hypothetical protein
MRQLLSSSATNALGLLFLRLLPRTQVPGHDKVAAGVKITHDGGAGGFLESGLGEAVLDRAGLALAIPLAELPAQ